MVKVLQTMRPESGLRIAQNCSKLAINRKNNNDVTICWQTSSSNFFDVVLFLLSTLVTGPKLMSVSSLLPELLQFLFYKGLTRNPEIGNTLVWVLPNIWRLEQVRVTKFEMNITTEMLLNAANCQGYRFYRF